MEHGDIRRELDDMNARMVAAESAVTVLRMDVDGIRTDMDDLGTDTPPPSPQYCPPPFPEGRSSPGRPELDTAFKVTVVSEPDPGSGIEGPYWRMYVPGGCVQLDGVPVKVKGPGGKDVEGEEVAIGPDDPGDALRCVVYTDKEGTAAARIDAVVSRGYGGPALSDGDVLLADVPLYLFSDYRGYGEMKPNAQVHLGVIALTSRGPCRVDSIDDATYSVPDGMEDTGEVITVNYTKAGDDCDDSGETSFTIPILRTKGGGGGGGDFSMDVTDEDVAGTQDHPNGGVKVTLSPSAGQGTNFTVWNGKDGENGKDAVVDVTQAANGATDVHKNGGTKVTLTPNNGGAAATFDVWNGNDGPAGSDGRSIVSASSGTPSQDGDYTVTPVTFTDDKGNRIGPVDVKAKNGSDAVPSYTFTFDMSKVIKYDPSDCQIKARRVIVTNGVVTYGGDWTMIENGQAVPHSEG